MVELSLFDVVIALSVALPIVLIGSAIYLRKTKVNRSISKQNDNSILNHYNVLMNINEDQQAVIKSVTMKTRMLQKKILELEGYSDKEEEEKPMDLTALMPLIEKIGIPKGQLELILQSEDAQKFLKKNKKVLSSVLPLLSTLTQNKQGAVNESSLPQNTA